MKKFKRLVALVLAGVLALGLLTACGTSTNKFGEEAEKRMIAGINSVRSENSVPLTNDSELRTKCANALKSIDSNGTIALKDTVLSEVKSGNNTRIITVIMVSTSPTFNSAYIKAHPNQRVSAMVLTSKDFGNMTPSIKNADDQEFYDTIERLGVATLTTADGKTYLAMAMQKSV